MLFSNELNDNSKEDVWSIGCIIIEMIINTILFRPQNDDPSLQLLCIVQYVGGLTYSLLDRFPVHIKKLFSKTKCDNHQQRLQRLLQQIFNQYTIYSNEYNKKEYLYDLLKQMFQFQSDKRIELQSLIEHPFYSINSLKNNLSINRLNLFQMNPSASIRMTVNLVRPLHQFSIHSGKQIKEKFKIRHVFYSSTKRTNK